MKYNTKIKNATAIHPQLINRIDYMSAIPIARSLLLDARHNLTRMELKKHQHQNKQEQK
jgi:hypothetical protein